MPVIRLRKAFRTDFLCGKDSQESCLCAEAASTKQDDAAGMHNPRYIKKMKKAGNGQDGKS